MAKKRKAGQGILDSLAFCPQFFRIGEVLKIAAAALAVMGALRFRPLRRRLVDTDDLTRRRGLHHLRDLQINGLAPNSLGHEHHRAIQANDAKAFAGIALHRAGIDVSFSQSFHVSILCYRFRMKDGLMPPQLISQASHFSSSCRSWSAKRAKDLLSRSLDRLMDSMSICPTATSRS